MLSYSIAVVQWYQTGYIGSLENVPVSWPHFFYSFAIISKNYFKDQVNQHLLLEVNVW